MKAAVMYPSEPLPRYEECPEPLAGNKDEIVVAVKAAALKHLDRGRATGNHYSSEAPVVKGRIIGGDGVCLLPDGSRVYAMGVDGMMAEKALIHADRVVPLPAGISDADAAALANGVIGSAMALRFKANVRPGDTVLINGATGFTGRLALQIARHYGAKKIIATGRNRDSMEELVALGADELIALDQSDEQIAEKLKTLHARSPITVVIDYLWGRSAELILAALQGKGQFTAETRYVSVGSMAGDKLTLSAANLRSVNLQLSGSGLGSWSREAVGLLFSEILPEMFQLTAQGRLKLKTREVELRNIAEAWELDMPAGSRLVVKIS